MGKRDLLFKILLSIVFALLIYRLGIYNNAYLLVAFINSTICIFQLLSHEESPYSLNKVVNVFIFVFFIIANAIQYANHSVVTTLWISFNDGEFVLFQLIVLVILLIYNGIYNIFPKIEKVWDNDEEGTVNQRLLIIISVAVTFLVVWHFRETPIRLFVRGLSGDVYQDALESSHTNLIFSKFLRVIPPACLLCGILAKIPKRASFFLLLLALISAFPTGLSRNAIIMYWLPPILAQMGIFKRKNMFILAILVGIFVLFPIMDNFRYYNGRVSLSFDLEYLDSMNYDASQQFMAVVQKDIVTFGRQLLGVLLFFVPRSIWPAKPIGSGAMMAVNEFAFSNISMPFWGEGYVNFGWIGVLVFDLFLAFLSIKLDRKYWGRQNRKGQSVVDGYYLILCSALFFILRGDLMSSFSFTVGAMMAYLVVVKLTYRKGTQGISGV